MVSETLEECVVLLTNAVLSVRLDSVPLLNVT